MGALEQLARCNDDAELWWDSSPLIFPQWREETLHNQDEVGRDELSRQIDAFYHPAGEPYGYLRGSTTNPPLTLQVLEMFWPAWKEWIMATHEQHPGWPSSLLAWVTYKTAVQRGAETLHGVFGLSERRYGYVCGQVDPRLAGDTGAMVQQGVELREMVPNIMVKMPGTAEGIEGIRQLASRGIATNCTLAFSLSQLVHTAEMAEAGVKEAEENGIDLSRWRSCATMMLGRFEDHPLFKEQAEERGVPLGPVELRWAGLAVFKKAYKIFTERGYRTQMLAASMRIGPEIDGKQHIWHLEKLAGATATLTIFPNIIEAFLSIYADREVTSQIDEDVPSDVLDSLLRVPYFRQAYEEDGMSPEQFVSYPPVIATGGSFVEAQDKFDEHVMSLL